MFLANSYKGVAKGVLRTPPSVSFCEGNNLQQVLTWKSGVYPHFDTLSYDNLLYFLMPLLLYFGKRGRGQQI